MGNCWEAFESAAEARGVFMARVAERTTEKVIGVASLYDAFPVIATMDRTAVEEVEAYMDAAGALTAGCRR